MPWFPSTLRTRLLLSVIAVELAAAALLGTFTLRLLESTAVRINDLRLGETIPLVAHSVSRAVFVRDLATLHAQLSEIVSKDGLTRIRVFNPQGLLLAESSAQGATPDDEADAEIRTVPIVMAGQTLGRMEIWVSKAQIANARRDSILQGVAVAAGEMLFSIGLLVLISLVLTRNVNALVRASRQAATGDLSARAQVTGRDEIARAALALNDMLTSLQRLQFDLSESERHYRDLVEGSIQGVAIVQDNKLAFANSAYAAMFGFESPESMLKIGSIEELVTPRERERLAGYARARIAGTPAPESYEMECVKVDGSVFWVFAMPRRVEWRGRPAIQVTFFDVTDRKRAEEEVRNSQARLSSILDSIFAMVALLSAEGTVLDVNRAPVEASGRQRDAIVGRLFWELEGMAHSKEVQVTAREMVRRAAAGEIAQADLPLLMRGKPVMLDVTLVPLRGVSGKPSQIVASAVDVSARVAAEAKLRASEVRYRTLVELAADGIFLHDEQGYFLDANPRGCVLLGHSLEVLRGMKLRDVLAPEEPERQDLPFDGMQTGSHMLIDRVVRHKDGRPVPVEISALKIPGGHLQTIVRDISDRKQREEAAREAEERLAQGQRLEALGQLVGGVAHDFNNLLTVIIGNSEYLTTEWSGDGARGETLGLILKAGRQAGELTRRLLAFARKQQLAVKLFDPNAVVLGMENLLRRTLGEHIQLSLDLDRSLWTAAADESQLESALLNLAINARDAMPSGGSLTFETRNAAVSPADAEKNPHLAPGEYAMIAVRDTGFGMPPDVSNRAFDPFFTTKDVGKGTGLGLSIVYGFVKQSRGCVDIESEVGKGTCIRIYLPRADAGGLVEPDAQDEGAPPTGLETVLVVEDDPLVRASAVSALAALGYTVLEAENASQALQRLRVSPTIDLLFTDVIMPGRMNGPELAQAALQMRPGLKVLFTSGYPRSAVFPDFAAGLAARMLAKPYRRMDLARKVREALQV